MQTTEELRTTTDIVQAVKQHDERRYSIKVGGEWYSDFGECPVAKGDVVELEFSMNGRYRNIRNVRVIGSAGARPKPETVTASPDTSRIGMEFVTMSPEE